MIIIADGGASKTSWRIIKDGNLHLSLNTQGLHPLFVTSEEISNVIINRILPNVAPENITSIFFYGAGCSQPEYVEVVMKPLNQLFKNALVRVESDLLGTARALCGTLPGMAAILGTGSNACQYDGINITRSIVSLGYILGDEGSGAVLGKRILKDYLVGTMPSHLSKLFLLEYDLDINKSLQHVYLNSQPNKFLASLAHFAFTHRRDPWIQQLLKTHFDEFICNIIKSFPDYDKQLLHLSGSVAAYFGEEIQQSAFCHNVKIGKIIQYPIDLLVDYHTKLR